MPAVQPPALVLVTGASGFIAAHVVRVLLEHGFSVRGTVRSKEKGDYLERLFHLKGRFEWVIVEDIEKEGAFDEAVKGVDAVEHTASPFHFNADDPSALIGPAVQGTIGLLDSIRRNAPQVKRVVVTSSVAAVIYPSAPKTFTEADWNDHSPRQTEKLHTAASAIDKYRASKSLAERAAWLFAEKHKEEIAWDLLTVNPPMVFGPIIHEVFSKESLNTSIADFNAIVRGERSAEELAKPLSNWVDVRDVADVHVLLLERGDKDVEGRFIVSNGPFTGQNILDALHSAPDPLPGIPEGNSNSGKALQMNVFSSEKAKRVLGLKLRNLEETARDTVISLRERGF